MYATQRKRQAAFRWVLFPSARQLVLQQQLPSEKLLREAREGPSLLVQASYLWEAPCKRKALSSLKRGSKGFVSFFLHLRKVLIGKGRQKWKKVPVQPHPTFGHLPLAMLGYAAQFPNTIAEYGILIKILLWYLGRDGARQQKIRLNCIRRIEKH